MSTRKSKPEMGTQSQSQSNELEQIVEKIVSEARAVADQAQSPDDAWYSVTIKREAGASTELVLQLSVNVKLGAVMYVVRTPMLRGKVNMIKLPTPEHVELFVRLARYMEERRDKLVQLMSAVAERIGAPRTVPRRRSSGEEIQL